MTSPSAKKRLSVEEALVRVTKGIPLLGSEYVSLEEAHGRVLAEDLAAQITHPPFISSAMDGYALLAEDLCDLPCRLKVIGEASAGHRFGGVLHKGQAVRIFTGAPLPRGADHILIQENAVREGDALIIKDGAGGDPGAYIRPEGGDFRKGEVVLKKNRKLTARDLMLGAAMNHHQIPVRRAARVSILATGDELVLPGELPNEDQIISSVPAGLQALIEQAGGKANFLGIADDRLESLEAAIGEAQNSDILVTIGGASIGDYDLVQEALLEAGMVLDFWTIAMRPGKPLMSGSLGKMRVLGVPGNPVSAVISACIFLLPMIHAFLGLSLPIKPRLEATLTTDLEANGPRAHYMRASLREEEGGAKLLVTPAPSQDSSLMALFAASDCLIIRPPHATALKAGSSVAILLFDF